MIVGIGTDLCDVRRIAAALERHGERFARRVLADGELATWHERRQRWPERGVRFVATRFSAKEAFAKAVGLGLRAPMTWRDCEVIHLPGGRPAFRLHGPLQQWFEARRWRAHLSPTDESDHAASFVVVEQDP